MISKLRKNLKSALKIGFYRDKQFYKKLIKKGDLCFDIGANLGKKSKVFLSLKAYVIAFEPQSTCIKELQKINHPNFSYVPFAVGSADEEKELQLANHIEVATFSKPFIDYFKNEELQWNTTEKVQVKKLDTLIETYGLPDFCKIDVEGYEYEIISNLNYTIPLIEFEFTGGFIPETIACIKVLGKNSTTFNYMLNELPIFKLEKWISGAEMIKILKNTPIDRLHGNIFVKSETK